MAADTLVHLTFAARPPAFAELPRTQVLVLRYYEALETHDTTSDHEYGVLVPASVCKGSKGPLPCGFKLLGTSTMPNFVRTSTDSLTDN